MLISVIVCCQACTTDKTEKEFKRICSEIAKEAAQTVFPSNHTTQFSKQEMDAINARERVLFQKWQDELKVLMKREPESIWADDAQYMITMLNLENPKERAVQLEFFIKNYPNAHIENWTEKKLILFLPSNERPILLCARDDLMDAYTDLGDKKKVEENRQIAMRDYPNYYEKFFKRMLESKDLSEKHRKEIEVLYNESISRQKKVKIN